MIDDEREVGAFEAKNKLSDLVEQASKGARIWITKRGRRVALLSSGAVATPALRTSLSQGFEGIRRKARPGPESLRDLVELGRK